MTKVSEFQRSCDVRLVVRLSCGRFGVKQQLLVLLGSCFERLPLIALSLDRKETSRGALTLTSENLSMSSLNS